VKSCARDFLSDAKWPEYREFCDGCTSRLTWISPSAAAGGVGLLIAEGPEASLVRDAPAHPLAPARRRALLQRYAQVAAGRLAAMQDPAGQAEIRAALRVE
jgi:hypothetical protein